MLPQFCSTQITNSLFTRKSFEFQYVTQIMFHVKNKVKDMLTCVSFEKQAVCFHEITLNT